MNRGLMGFPKSSTLSDLPFAQGSWRGTEFCHEHYSSIIHDQEGLLGSFKRLMEYIPVPAPRFSAKVRHVQDGPFSEPKTKSPGCLSEDQLPTTWQPPLAHPRCYSAPRRRGLR